MAIRILSVDTEVTGRAPAPLFPATPHYYGNKMLVGCVVEGNTVTCYTSCQDLVANLLFPKAGDSHIIVGHNVKYDLQVMAVGASVALSDTIGPNVQVWDTMVAGYVLSDQNWNRAPLDLESMCNGWSVPYSKNPEVTAHFGAGKCASELPTEVLVRYCIEDAKAALALALAQMRYMATEDSEHQPYSLMAAMQEVVLVTAEMELNGIPVCVTKWNQLTVEAGNEIDLRFAALRAEYHALERAGYGVSSIGASAYTGNRRVTAREELISPSTLENVLFASTIKVYSFYEHAFKNGRTVTRSKSTDMASNSLLQAPDIATWPRTPTGGYKLDSDTLTRHTPPHGRAFVDAVLAIREKEKLRSTYLDGFAKHFVASSASVPWPKGHAVHTNYNQTRTATGRLSASGPNVQNPPPEAKAMFVAPEEWVFMEMDYQQIEVVGLAVLSGDRQLSLDLRRGVDIHSQLYSDMYKRMPTKEERKGFKPLTFGLIYGAGDRELAKNAGVTRDVTKTFRKTFFSRYPGVKEWYDNVRLECDRTRFPTEKTSSMGMPLGSGSITLPTGRRLRFVENEVPWDKRLINFPPTDLANWPVQAFSTGDVVPTTLGAFTRALWGSEHSSYARLVATTHDSITLLVRANKVQEVWNFSRNLLSKTSEHIASYYKMKVEVPMSVTAGVAACWAECDANPIS